MWNKIQNIYIGTQKVRPSSWLPSAYQEVEYIQSSWTQYINTGYLPSSNPKIEIDLEFINWASNTWIPLYWRRWATNSTYFCLYVNSSSLYMTPNYAWFDPWTSSWVTISKNTKYNIVNNAWQFYLNWTLKTSASTTNTLADSTYPIFLFDNNINGARQWRNTQMKLYSCKMYNDNTLVRDFVPCYRKSDNVIWLYDRVNNSFYTNSWTWTFTKWPDV